MFRISFVLLLLNVPYIQNLKNVHACNTADWYEIGVKWAICCPQNQGPLLEILYTAIFCHAIPLSYTISNFKPCSRSLEDKKQFCRSYLHLQVYLIYRWYPKTNNQVRFILTLLKNNSEYSFIFPEIPVKAF